MFHSLPVSAHIWSFVGQRSPHFTCRGCFFSLHLPIPPHYVTYMQANIAPSFSMLTTLFRIMNPSSSLPTTTLLGTSTCPSTRSPACRRQCTMRSGSPPSPCFPCTDASKRSWTLSEDRSRTTWLESLCCSDLSHCAPHPGLFAASGQFLSKHHYIFSVNSNDVTVTSTQCGNNSFWWTASNSFSLAVSHPQKVNFSVRGVFRKTSNNILKATKTPDRSIS